VSIGMDEVSFWHLVAGGLAVGGWVPLRNWQRFLSLLKEPDFWPRAMVEEKSQPIEEKELSVKWGKVGIREEKGWVVFLGERETN